MTLSISHFYYNIKTDKYKLLVPRYHFSIRKATINFYFFLKNGIFLGTISQEEAPQILLDLCKADANSEEVNRTIERIFKLKAFL